MSHLGSIINTTKDQLDMADGELNDSAIQAAVITMMVEMMDACEWPDEDVVHALSELKGYCDLMYYYAARDFCGKELQRQAEMCSDGDVDTLELIQEALEK